MLCGIRKNINEKVPLEERKKQELIEETSVLLSCYYLNGMKDALCILAHRISDCWTLMIGYWKRNHENYADAQLGITGKMKIGESYEDAIKREIMEEANLSFDVGVLERINKTNIFVLDADHISPMEIPIKKIDRRSDTRTKIGVFIYGSKEKMVEILKAMIMQPTETNIGYYLIIPISTAVKMINKEMSTSRRNSTICFNLCHSD